MKMWQVLFDDHIGWKSSILVVAEYPSYCLQDALDEAADSDEGQKYVMHDVDLADFKTEKERDEYCDYLGNASQPFARENILIREVTIEQLLESEAPIRPINFDAEDFLKEALDVEHHDRTSERRACDICAAKENEYYLWAAKILTSATACPLTEAAFFWIQEGKTEKEFAEELEKERKEFLNNVDHRKCEACGTTNWGDDISTGWHNWHHETCGNCLAPFPKRPEEEDEEE